MNATDGLIIAVLVLLGLGCTLILHAIGRRNDRR